MQGPDDVGALDRRELLVAQRRPADVDALRPRRSSREELAVLAEHGLNVTRSFCFWPDFVPEPGASTRTLAAVRRLPRRTRRGRARRRSRRSSSGTCRARTGIRPGGRDATSTATSGSSSQQAWFAAEVARRFGRHPAVVGWLVSNEMPLYGGPGDDRGDRSVGQASSSRPCAAARRDAADLARRRRMGRRGLRRRQRLLAACARPARRLRRAARLPDGGRPGPPVPDRRVRVRARGRLRAARRARGVRRQLRLRVGRARRRTTTGRSSTRRCSQEPRGWIAWNNCDYDDLRDQDPYRHHVFEHALRPHRPRRQAEAAARTSWPSSRTFVAELAPRRLGAAFAGEAALLVPEHFERELPVHRRRVPARHPGAALLQAYVAAREADLPVALVRERDGLPGDGAPRTSRRAAKLLTAGGLERLRELAHAGTTVYLSYFAGSTTNQRGPWLAWLDELFGVRHRLRHGLVDPIEDEVVTFELRRAARRPRAGTRLVVPRSAGERARAPTCPSTRPGPRSSRSTPTAARRSSATRSERDRPSSAPTRSSTWRRRRRASTPRAPGGSTRRSPAAAGVPAAGPRRRPAGPRRSRAQRPGRASPCSSTARATRSPWSRSSRTGSSSRSRRPRRSARTSLDLVPLERATAGSGPQVRGRPLTDGGHDRRREGCARLTRPNSAACDRRAVRRAPRPTRKEARERHGNQEETRRHGGRPGDGRDHGDRGRRRGRGRREPLRVAPALADALHERNQWSPNNDLNPAKNWDYVTGLVGFAYETPFRYDPLKDKFIPWLASGGKWTSKTTLHDDRSQRRQVERRASR